MKLTTRKLVLMALFVAVAVSLNYLLIYIPNVKLFNFIIFASGYLLGIWEGAIVGVMAMFIYSTFNPYNLGMFPPLPLIAAQLFCMATIGAAGGLVCRLRPLVLEKASSYFLMAVLAIVLTLFYDFLTTLSTAYLFGALIPTLIVGIPFTLVSLVSNTIAFMVLAPLLPVLQGRLRTGEW
jgi:hypothetical protein